MLEQTRFPYLHRPEGEKLIEELKPKANDDLCSLDSFSTVAALVQALPDIYSEAELDAIRLEFEEFASNHASDADYDDPQDCRNAADVMGTVSATLGATTDEAQEMLREKAGALEDGGESEWTGGSLSRLEQPEHCSDAELDSMFRTLE